MIVSLFNWEHKKFLEAASYYIDAYDYSIGFPKVIITLHYPVQKTLNVMKGLSIFNMYHRNRIHVKGFSVSSYHAISKYTLESFLSRSEVFLYEYLILLNFIFEYHEVESVRKISQGIFMEERRDILPIFRSHRLFGIYSYTYHMRLIAYENLHTIGKYL